MSQLRDHSDLEVNGTAQNSLQQGHDIEVNHQQVQEWSEEQTKGFGPTDELHHQSPELVVTQRPKSKILCFPRKVTWLVLGLIAFIVVGAAVGGGVGGALAHRKHSPTTPSPSSATPTASASPGGQAQKSSPVYQNSSIAALHWNDTHSNVRHYRVFYQAKDGQLFESAWDSNTTQWNVSQITDNNMDIKLGTLLASNGGYPHADLSWDFVKDVFFTSSDGTIYERQSPYKEQRRIWGNDNFSGQFTASNLSSLTSFWYQNYTAGSQIYSVLFQELGANSLQIAKYADAPWGNTTQSIAIAEGSPLAVASTGAQFNLRLYMGNADNKLVQYEYILDTDDLSSLKRTTFDLFPQTPLCVSTQDNTAIFQDRTLPECALDTPWTHLILFANVNRSSLYLVSWNCSSGFLAQTSSIGSLLKPGREYVGLASHTDRRVYVMFDSGDGPEVEEWQVPDGGNSGDWSVVGKVPVNITSKS